MALFARRKKSARAASRPAATSALPVAPTITTTGKVRKKDVQKVQKAVGDAVSTRPANLLNTLTDPKTARRGLTIIKLVGPTVTPLAMSASVGIRGLLDDRRARQLGIDPARVGAYRGPTGTVAARVDGLRSSVDGLLSRRGTEPPVVRFCDAARRRLDDLSSAIDAAASMPTGRRKATVQAVTRDLNQIDADLMTFLVARPAP